MIKRVLLVTLLACSSAFAQAGDSVVTGKIQGPEGGPMGSIPVTLTTVSASNTVMVQTMTKDDGSFRFDNVRPGQYIVYTPALATTLSSAPNSTAQGIVLSPRVAVIARRVGTFYPGTADSAAATPINVASGTNVENVNFSLASGALIWGGPQFQEVTAKIVVEGGGTPVFHSDRFGLLFSDSPANVATTVVFQDGQGKPAAPLSRIERTQQPFLVNVLLPMPAFPGGEFRLALPEGSIRVGQVAPVREPARPASHVVTPARNYYYIKSMTFGATDLMKDLMTLQAPARDTLVITLARCSSNMTTQELFCQ